MKNLINNKKMYFIIFSLILIFLIVFVIILNFQIKKSISAILEVDNNKNFFIRLNTSNLNLFNGNKNISILLEGKQYFLKNVDFIYNNQNSYIIEFENDELYDLLKTNSLYEIKIFLGTKKLMNIIFNI